MKKDNLFNHQALKGKIVELFDTQQKFAKAIPMSRTSLNKKLKNKGSFTSNEIKRISELLNINCSEIGYYFLEVKNDRRNNKNRKGDKLI